jgi:hypothetical protein
MQISPSSPSIAMCALIKSASGFSVLSSTCTKTDGSIRGGSNSDGQSLPTTSGTPVIALQPGTNRSTSVSDENSAKAKKDEKEKKGDSLLTTGLKNLGNETITAADSAYTPYMFGHDISPLSFRYDPRDVHGQADISGAYTANS